MISCEFISSAEQDQNMVNKKIKTRLGLNSIFLSSSDHKVISTVCLQPNLYFIDAYKVHMLKS